ncbi:MAG: hypothetical protein QOI70_1159, partial [Microbacteriaceae bacterium]|nr:hypothetical protein [Microbacteriaceae bacterium]
TLTRSAEPAPNPLASEALAESEHAGE